MREINFNERGMNEEKEDLISKYTEIIINYLVIDDIESSTPISIFAQGLVSELKYLLTNLNTENEKEEYKVSVLVGISRNVLDFIENHDIDNLKLNTMRSAFPFIN